MVEIDNNTITIKKNISKMICYMQFNGGSSSDFGYLYLKIIKNGNVESTVQNSNINAITHLGAIYSLDNLIPGDTISFAYEHNINGISLSMSDSLIEIQ